MAVAGVSLGAEPFDSEDVRRLVRTTLVSLSASVQFYFERPFSKGFHELVGMLPEVGFDLHARRAVVAN